MNHATSSGDSFVKIEELIATFYDRNEASFGSLAAVDTVPPPYSRLLDHHEHMTVTVEAFYGETVNVTVHRAEETETAYAREITLVTADTQRTVQYGIVRLSPHALAPAVWQRIKSQDTPLGRVLIEHQVLREVELCELWKISAGTALAALMQIAPATEVFGRTALIYCDGEPAIELLEIVNPVDAVLDGCTA